MAVLTVTKTRVTIAAAAAALAALVGACPAGADPGTDPCELAVTFLCRFMPIAPTLDHDIDLTQGSGSINGTALPQVPAVDPHGGVTAPLPVP